jgi:cytochrome c oxidase cbb3-type subunit 3
LVIATALLCAVWVGGLRAGHDRAWADERSDGMRLLQARCAVCHSLDLITQQRLNRARWEATVTKMVHWGAQLSPEEQHLLTEYLAGRFHPDAPDALAEPEVAGQAPAGGSLPGPARAVAAGEARRGASLYGQNCLPCHGPGASGGVGPKLAQSPILKDDRRFRLTVREGRGAMPAWAGTLGDQEIADIHAWLKSLQ